MSYDSQIQAFAKFGMDAIDKLFADNSELMLSVDEKDAAEKIVGMTRLRATELPTPTSAQEMYVILEGIFGELLSAGQIAIKSYGLSAIGKEDYNKLAAAGK
jgi:hypothetical protein